MGLDDFTALEFVFEGGRCVMFTDTNGDTVVLRPKPETNLQPIRERLGLGDCLESMQVSLSTLKDVAGIAGSFVCTQDGRLLSRDIAAVFDDEVLAEAGSRLLPREGGVRGGGRRF